MKRIFNLIKGIIIVFAIIEILLLIIVEIWSHNQKIGGVIQLYHLMMGHGKYLKVGMH